MQKTALIFIVFFSIILKIIPAKNFTDINNVLTTPDAYRYARFAIEIKDNRYSQIDYLSDLPDFAIRQYPPSLLSSIAAYLSKITTININYFFCYLPVLLSVFFVIPLYLLLKSLNNPFLTIGAVSMGLFNFNYFERTKLGYFDTDCLMLFFVFSVLCFFTYAIKFKHDIQKSYLSLFFASLTTQVFLWWYDKHLFFVFIFCLCLFIGLLVNKFTLRTTILMVLFYTAFLNPFELLYYSHESPMIKDYLYGIIMGIQHFKMPINVYASTAELQPAKLQDMIDLSTDNTITFLISIVFLAILVIRNIHFFATYLPIILLGFSSFYLGYRYLIFIGAFIGVGVGFAVSSIMEYIQKRFNLSSAFINLVSIFFILGLTFPIQRILLETTKPILSEKVLDNLTFVKEKTEKDAYIFSWWDVGNMLQFYTNRATFTDNTHFEGFKMYAMVNAMLNEDEKTTYKNIAFLSNTKSKDYEKYKINIISFRDHMNNYAGKPQKPVYLYLYDKILNQVSLKDHNLPLQELQRLSIRIPTHFFTCSLSDEYIADCGDITINTRNNMLNIIDENVKKGYHSVNFYNKKHETFKSFILNENAQYKMYVILSKVGDVQQILAKKEYEETMLFKMLILSKKDLNHFELIYDDYPRMVLYKVK